MEIVSAPANNKSGRKVPSLLFFSLALNLFFVGVVGAIAIRHYFPAATSTNSAAAPRNAAARIDRLAATLPSADAEKLRAVFNARQSAVDTARQRFRRVQDTVHTALRTEPYDANAVRAAMAESRNARQGLEEALQEVIASAAAEMSSEGRRKLADWIPPRGAPASNRQ
ncbi:MAG TPA: periplasmic heavy metal sensor [Xanthobacteraceae bacterium]|jgi:uncharacterized membrane protein|nr:periplasmic heavy metal sensor [Xanthobacteraceae bacterium]